MANNFFFKKNYQYFSMFIEENVNQAQSFCYQQKNNQMVGTLGLYAKYVNF